MPDPVRPLLIEIPYDLILSFCMLPAFLCSCLPLSLFASVRLRICWFHPTRRHSSRMKQNLSSRNPIIRLNFRLLQPPSRERILAGGDSDIALASTFLSMPLCLRSPSLAYIFSSCLLKKIICSLALSVCYISLSISSLTLCLSLSSLYSLSLYSLLFLYVLSSDIFSLSPSFLFLDLIFLALLPLVFSPVLLLNPLPLFSNLLNSFHLSPLNCLPIESSLSVSWLPLPLHLSSPDTLLFQSPLHFFPRSSSLPLPSPALRSLLHAAARHPFTLAVASLPGVHGTEQMTIDLTRKKSMNSTFFRRKPTLLKLD